MLSGPGGLTKVDSGTLTLAAANTFSGNTLVSGGTLALGSPQALQLSTLDTSGSGAVSFTSLSSATLGGLTGSGTLSLLKSVALSVGNNNVSTTFSGVLNGPGSLTKIGSGELTLSGSSTYPGSTTISQGKLVVDGSLNSSDYSVTAALSAARAISGGSYGQCRRNSGPGRCAGRLAPERKPRAGIGCGDGLTTSTTPATSDMISMPSGNVTFNGQQFSNFAFAWTGQFRSRHLHA